MVSKKIFFLILILVVILMPQVVADKPPILQSVSPGLDVIFLLEDRDDSSRSDQDFGALDPQASRYAAIKLAAQFLAEDSFSFNPQSEHWLSVILFDGEIDPGSDGQGVFIDSLMIAPDDLEEMNALNAQIDNTIRPPNKPSCSNEDPARCGADFATAFATAQDLLENRPVSANRKQMIIVLTFNGCADTDACDEDRSFNFQMQNVTATVAALAENNVHLYLYTIHGSDTRYEFGNRFWSQMTDDNWLNDVAPLIDGEIDILPTAQDYLPRVREILSRQVDLSRINPQSIAIESHETPLAIEPYLNSFSVTVYKNQPSNIVELVYNNINDPSQPEIEIRDLDFVVTFTVYDPPPGPFWTLKAPVPSQDAILSEVPAQSSVTLLDVTAQLPLSVAKFYHPLQIRFAPLGFINPVLLYADRSFDLKPVAIIENVETGQVWRIPLNLNRDEGSSDQGYYLGDFYTINAGEHRLRIEQTGMLSTRLQNPSERNFDSRPVVFDLVSINSPVQFEDWNYAVGFFDENGNSIPLTNLAPSMNVVATLHHGNEMVALNRQPTSNTSRGVFEAHHVFPKHGEYQLTVRVTTTDSEGTQVYVTPHQEDGRYPLMVQPAPLLLELQPDPDHQRAVTELRQYDPFVVRFRPQNLDTSLFQSTYNLTIEGIITNTLTQEQWRIAMPLQSSGFYEGKFYAMSAGTHEVTLVGFTDSGGVRDIYLTENQESLTFNARAITVGLMNATASKQFEEWQFTIALLDGEQPISSALGESVMPQIAVVIQKEVQVVTQTNGNQLTEQTRIERDPIACQPSEIGQWLCNHTFTLSGDNLLLIAGSVQPASTLGGGRDRLAVTPANPNGVAITVEPAAVVFTADAAERLMLEPIRLSLDASGSVGNAMLRNDYGMEAIFIIEGGEYNPATDSYTQRWEIPAEAVSDSAAAYTTVFYPTVPGEHRVSVSYRGEGEKGLAQLEATPFTFNARPITIAFEPLPENWWKLSNGTVQVEVERSLTLRVQFFDGEPADDANNILTQTPSLPVTVQGIVFRPGSNVGERVSFEPGTDNTYIGGIENLDQIGDYRLQVVAEVVDSSGKTQQLPITASLREGLIFTVIPVQSITLQVNRGTEREQYSTNIMPFSKTDMVIDVDTLTRDEAGNLIPIQPAAIFLDQTLVTLKDWLKVSVDGKEIPASQYRLSFPDELDNGFRLQIAEVGTGSHDVEVQMRNNFEPTFGIRHDAAYSFVQTTLQRSRHPGQWAIYILTPLTLLAASSYAGYRRWSFLTTYKINQGVLVLEDEYGREIWSRNLKGRAIQTYKKNNTDIKGWGRALLDAIRVESGPDLQMHQQVKITVTQEGQKLPRALEMKLDGSSGREQLPRARGGFYLRVKEK